MIRILIADDHRLAREGYKALLYRERDIQVIGEARDGIEAVDITEQLAPDVVLMDIAVPGQNGVSAIKQIRALQCNVRILVVSMVMDKRTIEQAFENGASGYIFKHDEREVLVSAIRAVYADKTYLSALVSQALAEQGTTTEGYYFAPHPPEHREYIRRGFR